MKDAPSSRGFAATNSAELSNGSSSETIGTETENLNGSNEGSIDPNDHSFFIQYHPELAEKLSKHNSTYSVSGRCLSIVMSRMIYWSRYAKWRFQGKLWYWKNQTELSEETGFSVKQINRALKVLVELGIIVREKFQKHYYRQVYYYHIPASPHTKELKPSTRTSRSSSSRIVSSASSGSHHRQQFHSRPTAAPVVPGANPPIHTSTPVGSIPSTANDPAAAAPAGSVPTRPVQQSAAECSSKIHKSKEIKSIGTKCPNQTLEIPSSIKQTLLSIVEKCEMYGREDIYRERFGLIA